MLPMGIIVKRVIALGTHRVTNGPGGKLSQSIIPKHSFTGGVTPPEGE